MYNKILTTYKRASTDRHSKNLELRSHPLIATYTNRAESPGLLHRDDPKLVKAYDGLHSSRFFVIRNLPPESCMNLHTVCNIASWLIGV
jgi:hypothetical protein